MPRIHEDIYIDVDVDDLLQMCNRKDIDEIIHYLIDKKYITGENLIQDVLSVPDHEIKECISKIEKNLIQLTVEEEESLKKIANRF